MSKSHLELQMGTRQSTKCTEISRLAFQLWCIIPVPGRSSATILLSCVCQALNATPLAKAFFPICRQNIQHLNPQPCISAGDLIAMCATSLWPSLFIPRCDLSQAVEASKDWPCPGPCPGCHSLALPSSPPARGYPAQGTLPVELIHLSQNSSRRRWWRRMTCAEEGGGAAGADALWLSGQRRQCALLGAVGPAPVPE